MWKSNRTLHILTGPTFSNYHRHGELWRTLEKLCPLWRNSVKLFIPELLENFLTQLLQNLLEVDLLLCFTQLSLRFRWRTTDQTFSCRILGKEQNTYFHQVQLPMIKMPHRFGVITTIVRCWCDVLTVERWMIFEVHAVWCYKLSRVYCSLYVCLICGSSWRKFGWPAVSCFHVVVHCCTRFGTRIFHIYFRTFSYWEFSAVLRQVQLQ